MKRYLSILLCCIFLMIPTGSVWAGEDDDVEWFEMQEEEFSISVDESSEIMPYTLYLAGVGTYITKLNSSKIGMHVEVYCSDTVKTISTTFYLQKKYNGVWKNVSSGVVSTSNASYMSKSVSVSGVTSGTYRAKTVTMVTDKFGYSESLTGYSGSIVI